MNKEIKFRAWFKGTKNCLPKIINKIDLIDFYKGIIIPDLSNDEFHIFPECILMQYIEQKDDDGKEIYEGDILQCTCHDFMFRGWVIYDTDECSYKLRSLNNEEYFLFQMNPTNSLFKESPLSRLVVGNIYEDLPNFEEITDFFKGEDK